MSKRKISKYRGSVRALKSIAAKPAFDAAGFLEYVESLAPHLQITLGDVALYDAVFRLRAFVSLFSFSNGRAELSIGPPATDLEWFAERFKKYLEGTRTLDEAFRLKKPTKGRGSAKEKVRLRAREIQARAIFVESLSGGALIKQALAKVKKELGCSAGEADSLVYRDRSSLRSNTVRKPSFRK